MRKIRFLLASLLAFGLMAGTALADVNAVTPSTNDINRTNGWAHVNQVSSDIGTVDLEFISTRGFASCFEYRTDGDTSQATGDNFNPAITDGLYPFKCENNSTSTMTLNADEYVEVRMVFGAETDERFDWTRFDVLPDATTRADCVSGGWEDFGFKNQGQCVRYVNTGKDSRVADQPAKTIELMNIDSPNLRTAPSSPRSNVTVATPPVSVARSSFAFRGERTGMTTARASTVSGPIPL